MCDGSESGHVFCVRCFGWMVALALGRQQSKFGSGRDIEPD